MANPVSKLPLLPPPPPPFFCAARFCIITLLSILDKQGLAQSFVEEIGASCCHTLTAAQAADEGALRSRLDANLDNGTTGIIYGWACDIEDPIQVESGLGAALILLQQLGERGLSPTVHLLTSQVFGESGYERCTGRTQTGTCGTKCVVKQSPSQ